MPYSSRPVAVAVPDAGSRQILLLVAVLALEGDDQGGNDIVGDGTRTEENKVVLLVVFSIQNGT